MHFVWKRTKASRPKLIKLIDGVLIVCFNLNWRFSIFKKFKNSSQWISRFVGITLSFSDSELRNPNFGLSDRKEKIFLWASSESFRTVKFEVSLENLKFRTLNWSSTLIFKPLRLVLQVWTRSCLDLDDWKHSESFNRLNRQVSIYRLETIQRRLTICKKVLSFNCLGSYNLLNFRCRVQCC